MVRGDDLWASTGAQVALMAVLGAEPPRYWHVPLWRDPQGQRLSKRAAAEGLAGLRQSGGDGPAVIGLLAASLGLVPGGSRLSAQELCQQLQLSELMAAVHGPFPLTQQNPRADKA